MFDSSLSRLFGRFNCTAFVVMAAAVMMAETEGVRNSNRLEWYEVEVAYISIVHTPRTCMPQPCQVPLQV